jgi:hypothetical protein
MGQKPPKSQEMQRSGDTVFWTFLLWCTWYYNSFSTRQILPCSTLPLLDSDVTSVEITETDLRFVFSSQN